MNCSSFFAWCAGAILLVGLNGCSVPQHSGRGSVARHVEPTTKAGYWLYLPEEFVKTRGKRKDHQAWPLVVTFHGTKPFDRANPQIREWQEEADRYGFVVIAPELETCTATMQFPLRDPNQSCIRRDEAATLAIMDEVVHKYHADPARVLSTGWSTGGYIAHYMVNRHPDRFSCLAIREAPFSESLLDVDRVPEYREMKVAVYSSENDLLVCRTGSRRAVEWYRNNGFSVEFKCVVGLGHQRIPGPAADFFASTINAKPKTPPVPAAYVLKDALPDASP